ncbi:MAG: hypothetical protein NTV52_24890 [Acidobacteria bacterium]|nr:hypothetical protein [Acidobacteriota bacterium]
MGGDGDFFGDGADFEADVEAGGLADLELDVLADELFEPVGFDGEGVLAGDQERDGVATGFVGGDFGGGVGLGVDGFKAGLGDGGASGVGDGAGERGAEVLGGEGGEEGEEEEEARTGRTL